MSCLVISRAPSSAAYRLLGGTRWAAIWSYRTAKFRLKLLATGPPMTDFTSAAREGKAGLRDGKALVASIAILPVSPVTLLSASEMAAPGTATTTTSAPLASPPSRPSMVTSWPALRHRAASPPPTFPRPMVTMFIWCSLPGAGRAIWQACAGGLARPVHRTAAAGLIRLLEAACTNKHMPNTCCVKQLSERERPADHSQGIESCCVKQLHSGRDEPASRAADPRRRDGVAGSGPRSDRHP